MEAEEEEEAAGVQRRRGEGATRRLCSARQIGRPFFPLLALVLPQFGGAGRRCLGSLAAKTSA